MAKVSEAVASDRTNPKALGRRLKQVRAQHGLSRRQAARSAGLTRHELASYERGRGRLSGADLASIAGSCGVDPSDLLAPDELASSAPLLPERDPLRVGSDLASLSVGDHYTHLAAPPDQDPIDHEPDAAASSEHDQDPEQPSDREPGTPASSERDQDPDAEARALLATYLDLVAALRADPEGDDVAPPIVPDTVRQPDLVVLADALDRSPPDVEAMLWSNPAPAPAAGVELIAPRWRFGTILPTAATSATSDRGGVRWALADHRCSGSSTIEATVDLTGGPGFGLLVRAGLDERSRLSGYSIDVDVDVDGAYLLRYWDRDEQHWWPLAHASVGDLTPLFGRHVVRVDIDHDELQVAVDGISVLSVPDLHACATGAGVLPADGTQVGFAVFDTSLLTVDGFRVLRR